MPDMPPFARWRPGPPQKLGYTSAGTHVARKEWLIGHSAEGPVSAALRELDKPDRQASWHATIAYDGTVYWHYDATAVCWASGAPTPNAKGVAIEHEGRAGEPLTPAQVHSLGRTAAWLYRRFSWSSIERRETLWEHREMAQFGAAPTACPSGRIPWPQVQAWAAIYIVGGDPVDWSRVVEVLLADKRARDQLVAAMMADGPVHLAIDSAKRDAWRRQLGGSGGGASPAPDVRAEIQSALAEVARRAELGTDDLGRGLWALWRRLQAVSRALDPRQPVP